VGTDAPYCRCQEDQGVVPSTLGIADLRQLPENPAVDPTGNSPNGKERLASAWSVLHRTREELECARSLKDWGEELRQVERSVLACEAAVRAIRRALLVAAMGVAPQGVSSQELRSEGFGFYTPSLPSGAPHPLAWVGGEKIEEMNATGQQELEKFLRRVLDVVETMIMVKERAASDRLQMEARERMERALEIIAQFTPRVTDSVLVQRIQASVGHYAEMLEA
jgi:hypothetical protein